MTYLRFVNRPGGEILPRRHRDWRARWQEHNSGAVRFGRGDQSTRKEVGALTTLADENVT